MSSIIDTNTGKIEDWSIYIKNMHNFICVKLTDKIQDNILKNKSVWLLHINNDTFQTSNIVKFDSDDLSINTYSGSKYYLGESKDDYNIEFLKQYFNN
jgi:hypothetical protein